MKKIVALLLAILMMISAASAMAEVTVGIVNNPPSESGYREANVKDFEKVFSAAPANFGKVAICRGPLVYCLEMPTDGKLSPFGVRIPLNAEFTLENLDELLPGTKGLSCEALYGDLPEELYSTEKPQYHTEKITLVPYALWQNRGAAQMAVYLPFER